MNREGTISLLTDFGLSDPYVGIVKGVILGINPRARLVDITHQVPPGSVLDAAFILLQAYAFFPEGTVHIAVVDPGVGGRRRPIAVQTRGHLFVGPDNGLFWPIVDRSPSCRIVHLQEAHYFLPKISETFHGRDIFAPVGAHLSMGLDIGRLGSSIDDPTSLAIPCPEEIDHTLKGQVMRVDHFGNLITNIHGETLREFLGRSRAVFRIGMIRIEGIRRTYSDMAPGEATALIGSAGYLEISVNLGRACELDGLSTKKTIGMPVEVERL